MATCYCWITCFSKLHFLSSLATFIILWKYLTEKHFNNGCFKDMMDSLNLNPIYDIYITDEKTSESIKLGDLEDYSSSNLKISSAEIFKWKNKYINIKRIENYKNGESTYKPINYITFGNSSNISNCKSIKFDDDSYLFYSNKENYPDIFDLKISYRKIPYPNLNKKCNICFSKKCKVNIGECINGNNFKMVDSDDTDNFINYNNIKIENKNNIEYFKPEQINLFTRARYYDKSYDESAKNVILFSKKYFLLLIIIIILLKLIQLIPLIFIPTYNNPYCSCCNFIFIIIDFITTAPLIVLYVKTTPSSTEKDKSYTNYLNEMNFPEIRIILLMFIIGYSTLFALCSNSFAYLGKPTYCSFCNSNNGELNGKILDKNCKKKEILKNLNEIEDELKALNQEKNELEKNLEDIIIKIRNINVANDLVIFKRYIKSTFKAKINIYNNIDLAIENYEKILEKRKNLLKELETQYKEYQFPEIYNILKGEKLDINCIYFDKNISAFDEYSSSYEFFKFLKNSINGAFFGIKEVADLDYVKSNLTENFKFILIYACDSCEISDIEFFKEYYIYFSDILLLTIDPEEIKELKQYNNVRDIECNFYDIILKLISINYSFNLDTANKYKAYSLTLYSDYKNSENIQKCHLELLKNTNLNDENAVDKILSNGLNDEEYRKWISFLDNDLEEIPDKEDNKKEQINFNNNVQDIDIKEEDDDEDIKIISKSPKPENEDPNIFINHSKDPDISIDINHYNKIGAEDNAPDINLFGPAIVLKTNKSHQNKEESKESERSKECLIKNVNIEIKRIYLAKIKKTEKKLIKEFNNYKTGEGILELYTREKEQFYTNVNKWLFSLNLRIYEKIGPITGKLINFLYKLIFQQKNEKNIGSQKCIKLYRAMAIKKSDIFLYKASEGDIFCYPGFTSTTSNSGVLDIFKNNLPLRMKALDEYFNCEIQLDYNINDNDVYQEADIQEYSRMDEDERLFPPFSFFKIKRVSFNDGTKDGKELPIKEIHDGTFEHPFLIELEIINRDFYLDKTIINNEKYDYNKNENRWDLI